MVINGIFKVVKRFPKVAVNSIANSDGAAGGLKMDIGGPAGPSAGRKKL